MVQGLQGKRQRKKLAGYFTKRQRNFTGLQGKESGNCFGGDLRKRKTCGPKLTSKQKCQAGHQIAPKSLPRRGARN